jgi:hypothetical protein
MHAMMLPLHKGIIVPLVGTLFLLMAPASGAAAPEAGGVSADPGAMSHPTTGGAAFGAGGHRVPGRPRIRSIRAAAARVTAGSAVQLVVRVDRARARTVHLRAVIAGNGVRRLSIDLGHVPTGRTVRASLSADLPPGRYRVRLLALGRRGEHAVQGRTVARVQVVAAPKPKPPAPKPAPVPAPPLVAPAPAPTVAGGVFPVQGFHTYGGKDAVFGAGRTGHTHQGQDVTAARGTPVVAPVAGTVLFTDYQAGAAGEYVVLHADDGREMFFAHCVRHSTVVKQDQRVGPGGRLCDVGATGDATGPHLHFEIWPDGWRQIKHTRPVDPLPQLRAWDGLS